MIIIISCGIGLILIFHPLASFSYEITGNSLKAKWKILKFIPFMTKKIKFEDIQEVREFLFKKDIFYTIFGNLFDRGVTVILKRRIFLFKKVYITPENPEAFIKQINDAIQTMQGTR